uniref:Fibrinogen C-terminal domain-containing protein n=1 Tax=Ursus maritimus TaxID=29073 RepID=A0A452TJ28_URSMA
MPPCAPQVSGIRGDALERGCLQQPLDCDDIYAQGYQVDGVYLIYPSGPSVPVPVFCDMTTEGGKWTVFQKRFNGSVSFFRGWNDYKLGFGRADGEDWLGKAGNGASRGPPRARALLTSCPAPPQSCTICIS